MTCIVINMLLESLEISKELIDTPFLLTGVLMAFFFIRRFFKTVLHRHYYHKWIDAVIVLPGTMLHEISHYLMAVICMSKITKFTVWPKLNGNSIIYGAVHHYTYFKLLLIPISLAPMFLNGFVALIVSQLTINYMVKIYLLSVILGAALPSSADIKGMFKGMMSIGFFLSLSIAWLYKEEFTEILRIAYSFLMNMSTRAMISPLVDIIVLYMVGSIMIFMMQKRRFTEYE